MKRSEMRNLQGEYVEALPPKKEGVVGNEAQRNEESFNRSKLLPELIRKYCFFFLIE
jgi:hypothetical protein